MQMVVGTLEWLDNGRYRSCGSWVLIFCAAVASQDNSARNAAGGLNVYTDKSTGCEYLGRDGALTPRLNAEGKQICRR